MNDITRFMDEKGRIKTWASKMEAKLEIIKYISTKFECGRFYSEKEVNAIIEDWHTFGDYFLLRRGLIDYHLLFRTRNGSRYWKDESDTRVDLISLIESNYDIGNIRSIFKKSGDTATHTYYILSDKGEYILKNTEQPQLTCLEPEASAPPNIHTKTGVHLLNHDNNTYILQNYAIPL